MFRIYNISKTLSGEVSVNARHIFYDMLYNFVNSAKATNITADAAIKAIYAAAALPGKFLVSSNIPDTVTYEYTDSNPINILLGDEGLLALLAKGELHRDNYNVQLKLEIGANRGLVIRYRKNLTGLDMDIDTSGIATCIKPIAKNKEGDPLYQPEQFIDSPHIGSYFMPIYRTLPLNDIKAESEEYPTTAAAYTAMRKQAGAFFDCEGDKPLLNAKVNFVLLRDTHVYKEFAALETIFLGDSVTVLYSELGVNMTAKCIRYTYDCLLLRYETIELGAFRGDFAVNAGQQLNKLQTAVSTGSANTAISGIPERVAALETKMAAHAHTELDGTPKIDYTQLLNLPK